MARIRTIKPEFPQSESMGRVSRDARLLFVMLWPVCDDHGRTRAASRMLASTLFPYDDDAKDLIDGWLDELEREGCIRRYENNGSAYLEVCNWLIHQKIDKPSKPLFPEPSRAVESVREDSRLLLGKEGKGIEASGAETARSKRGTRLPADWRPEEPEMRWAADVRPDVDAEVEVEKFRDYWTAKPGQGGVKLSWDATWRNWIRNASPSRGKVVPIEAPRVRRELA